MVACAEYGGCLGSVLVVTGADTDKSIDSCRNGDGWLQSLRWRASGWRGAATSICCQQAIAETWEQKPWKHPGECQLFAGLVQHFDQVRCV